MVLPEAPARAIARLEQAGFEAWAVGGCVRDGLRGSVPQDYDLCTAATPEQMKTVFAGERLIETGLRHGTLTLLTAQGPIEITTYRTDGAYSDGRHPDSVRFVRSIREDLARRDFTVNAMAFHPQRGVMDPFGGQQDLAQKTLRAVGDPARRFQEDALRILRGARFAAQLGFIVEENTAREMLRQRARLDMVAPERLREEVLHLLCGRYAGHSLRAYREIIAQVLPEVRPMFDLDQQNPHHKYDVWEHTLRALEQTPADRTLRLAVLLHDSGKPACKTVDENGIGHFRGHPQKSEEYTRAIAARLRLERGMADALLLLVSRHDVPLGDTSKLLRRRLAQIGQTHVRQLLSIKKSDAVGQGSDPSRIGTLLAQEEMLEKILREDNCLSLRQLAVRGEDMIALGLRERAVGDMLGRLLDHVLEAPEDNEKKILLSLARAYAAETETKT